MDTRIARTLHVNEQLVRTSQLVAAGVSRATIARTIARGELTAVCDGWVGTPRAPQLGVIALAHGGRVTGSTALAQQGVWDAGDRRVHVALHGHGNGRHRSLRAPIAGFAPPKHPATGLVRHWTAPRLADPSQPLWRTSVIDSIMIVARESSSDQLLATIESALHVKALNASGLPVLRAALPQRIRKLVDLVDDRSESGLETLMRLGLERLGCNVEPQAGIPLIGPNGRAGRVDFLVDGWLAIEVDGDEFHDPAADRVRNSVLVRLGYRWHRFGYRQIMHDWASVEATMRELLRYPPGFARPDRGTFRA